MELKPCPFCGEKMIDHSDEEGPGDFEHPRDGGLCILSEFEFPIKDRGAWNKREEVK